MLTPMSSTLGCEVEIIKHPKTVTVGGGAGPCASHAGQPSAAIRQALAEVLQDEGAQRVVPRSSRSRRASLGQRPGPGGAAAVSVYLRDNTDVRRRTRVDAYGPSAQVSATAALDRASTQLASGRRGLPVGRQWNRAGQFRRLGCASGGRVPRLGHL